MSSKKVIVSPSHEVTLSPQAEYEANRGVGRRTFLATMGGGLATAIALSPFANAQVSESPTDAIRRLVSQRRIINVHEHIQGRENTDELLTIMDALGIGRTILMGSPWFTISLYERAGFTRYDENNAAIVAMAQERSDRLEAWPTVNPLDDDKLEKVRSLVAQGASGVKLYLGHGYTARRSNQYIFHPIAMDAPTMLPLYEYLSEYALPLCFHVNPAKPGFMDEFVSVLKRFPDLKVNTPHYMLSSMVHSRLKEMFSVFPNLVVDISFGHDDYLKTGLQRISANAGRFRELIHAFPERFLFGTDYVVTSLRPRDFMWYASRTQAYLDMLSREAYTTSLIPGRTLNGLALEPALLERILYLNFEAFRSKTPQGTALNRELNWNNLRVRPVERKPGEALEPPMRRFGR